jgi:serpin B
MKKPILAFALLASICACAPGAGVVVQSNTPREENPLVSASALADVAKAERHLAGALLKDAAGNALLSPHSIDSALAMLYAGAAGETRAQMKAALAFPDDAALNGALDKMDLTLSSRTGAQINDANAVWGQLHGKFAPAYLDTLARFYGAGMHTVDFANDHEGARDTINRWVDFETEGHIPELFADGDITSDTKLALTNAIYFHAQWDQKLDDAGQRAFHGTHDEQAAFMTVTRTLAHARVDGAESVELPYANGKLALLVVVPDDIDAVDVGGSLLADLDHAARPDDVQLFLPKVTMKSSIALGEDLQKLGMVDAFSDGADFSGIDGGHDLSVGSAVHQAWIQIDADGTTAAAATGIGVVATAVEEPAIVDVNKPYLFFLRDKPTGALLFVGRVVDPT